MQVSFHKLARESLDEEHLPHKVIEWAETVKQRLRDEDGVVRLVDLDGEQEMRGIWGWVMEAWGVSSFVLSLRLVSSQVLQEPERDFWGTIQWRGRSLLWKSFESPAQLSSRSTHRNRAHLPSSLLLRDAS